jgi:hypothetical protein
LVKETDVRLVPEKAYCPISSKVLGKANVVIGQLKNALFPILVKLLSTVIEVKLAQFSNILFGITVKFEGIVKLVIPLGKATNELPALLYKIPSMLSYTAFAELQLIAVPLKFSKAVETSVTDEGTVTEVNKESVVLLGEKNR